MGFSRQRSAILAAVLGRAIPEAEPRALASFLLDAAEAAGRVRSMLTSVHTGWTRNRTEEDATALARTLESEMQHRLLAMTAGTAGGFRFEINPGPEKPMAMLTVPGVRGDLPDGRWSFG